MKWLAQHRWAALGFAVSAAYWPGMLAGSFVPRWAVVALGIPLVSRLDLRSVPKEALALLGVMLALCAVSLGRSPWIEAGIGDFIFVVILSLAFVAGAALDSLDDVMTGAVLGFIPSALLAPAQLLGWHPLLEINPPGGLFYSSEVMGEYAALLAIWALLSRRWWLAALPVTALVLTASRVGCLAVVLALLVYAPVPRLARAGGAVALLAALPLVLFGLKFGAADHTFHRFVLWGTAVLAFTPLGNGLGWGSAAFPFEEFVHSDALQAMAEIGIGGGGLLLIPVLAFVGKRGSRAERAVFVVACIEVVVSFPLHFPASGFVAAVVAGYLVGLGPRVRDQSRPVAALDEPRRVWRRDAAGADDERGRPGRGLVSVRRLHAWLAPVRAEATCRAGAR